MFAVQNVTFTDVEAPDAAKVMATVLFPKDPKRRLEVWWQNEAARSGIYLIVINGQSAWSTPKGLRLGLGLAAIEKLNGKPFKLKGFDKDGGSVTDWQEGALASLPGGCKVGARLAPSPKAPPAARDEVTSTKEFLSTDASMRAVQPDMSTGGSSSPVIRAATAAKTCPAALAGAWTLRGLPASLRARAISRILSKPFMFRFQACSGIFSPVADSIAAS